MILAAGLGTRMRPLTDHCPKPLLRAGHDSLIGHLLHGLRKAGLTDIVVNHSWHGGVLEKALGSGDAYGVRITYSREEQPLETAGGIRRALPLLDGGNDQPFAVVNGDIWTDFDFSHLGAAAEELGHRQGLLVLVDNPAHHPQGDFSLAADGTVSADGQPRLTFAGIGLYRPSLFATLPDGPWPLAPLLREAMQQHRIGGLHYRGAWQDIGTPQRLHDLDASLQKLPPVRS